MKRYFLGLIPYEKTPVVRIPFAGHTATFEVHKAGKKRVIWVIDLCYDLRKDSIAYCLTDSVTKPWTPVNCTLEEIFE